MLLLGLIENILLRALHPTSFPANSSSEFNRLVVSLQQYYLQLHHWLCPLLKDQLLLLSVLQHRNYLIG